MTSPLISPGPGSLHYTANRSKSSEHKSRNHAVGSRQQHGFLVLMLLVVNCFKCEAKQDVGRVSAGSAGARSAHSRLHCPPVLHLRFRVRTILRRSTGYNQGAQVRLRDWLLPQTERNTAKWEQLYRSCCNSAGTLLRDEIRPITARIHTVLPLNEVQISRLGTYAKVTTFDTFLWEQRCHQSV